jgi:hypothetical protein
LLGESPTDDLEILDLRSIDALGLPRGGFGREPGGAKNSG